MFLLLENGCQCHMNHKYVAMEVLVQSEPCFSFKLPAPLKHIETHVLRVQLNGCFLDVFWMSLWMSFGCFLDVFGMSFGYPWDVFWMSFGRFLDVFWMSLGCLLDVFWAVFGCLLDVFWMSFGCF